MKENIKLLKFSPTIAEHDLKTKINQMEKFFTKEKHVKCVVFFPGRNILHPENGEKIFDYILSNIKNGKLVNRGKLKGNTMEMFLVPKE
jgi:translation initiation factor IF-3